ncbi:MAG TPA: hypothetical protein VM760_09005 [Sphingomicrobium sp.]|nr:hypothetical protein [Sphingomicrobium sp.]
MRRLLSPVLGSLLIVSLQATGADFVPPKTDDELMANALSAAPAAVAVAATVIAFDEKGEHSDAAARNRAIHLHSR